MPFKFFSLFLHNFVKKFDSFLSNFLILCTFSEKFKENGNYTKAEVTLSNAIANGGTMMKPWLIRRVANTQGTTTASGAPEAYLMYAKALKTEGIHVSEHSGYRPQSNGLQ